MVGRRGPNGCHNCDYGECLPSNEYFCRRYPPSLIYLGDDDGETTHSPLTSPYTWCGEWKEREDG